MYSHSIFNTLCYIPYSIWIWIQGFILYYLTKELTEFFFNKNCSKVKQGSKISMCLLAVTYWRNFFHRNLHTKHSSVYKKSVLQNTINVSQIVYKHMLITHSSKQVFSGSRLQLFICNFLTLSPFHVTYIFLSIVSNQDICICARGQEKVWQ